jgi:hypothetical protein
MRSSFSVVILVAALNLACRGPEGPAGATGPQGPAGPTTRLPSYCNTTAAGVGAGNAWTLSASCNAAKDIPVEGWCLATQELPTGAFLSVSSPVNWDNTSLVAGWTCTWGWTAGATQLGFTGRAEICCETPQ